jgi:hypothetical protein
VTDATLPGATSRPSRERLSALGGGAVNARRPRGTRGRSERERAHLGRRARLAESIDGAEPSGSIKPVMAGRYAAAST